MESLTEAILWSTLAIVVAQSTSILIMWGLGLPPKKLVHEIEDVQNPAVGASFFVISLVVSLYISVYFSNGYSPIESFGESALWFISGLAVGGAYMVLIFIIAHRLMDREDDESVYRYIQREIIEEQNASLALFLGGLSLSPFLGIVFQII